MVKRNLVAFLIILTFLIACNSSPSGYVSVPAMTLTAIPFNVAQDNLDLQTTRNALQIEDNLTRQAQTQAVMFGTQDAYTRVAATVTAQAPLNELTIEQTRQSINATGTIQAIEAVGTAAAMDSLVTIERQLANDEIARLNHLRQMESIRLYFENFYQGLYILAILVVILVVAVVGSIVAGGLHNYYAPVKFHPDGNIKSIHPRLLDKLPKDYLRISKPEVLTLPEPTMEIKPLPALPSGHVMIAGETGSGKSTAMIQVLKHRDNVTVLDPHDNTETWGEFRVIGGGRKFDQIAGYLQWMQTELQRRYRQRSQGQKEFEPLTVATDELPAIVSEIGKDFGLVWRQWIREGRKVGLFIVVCTQSTRVKTLGIEGEGDLLENFSYILELGKLAQTDFKQLTQNMDRPAVIRSIGGVYPITIPYVENITPRTSLPMITYADPENLTHEDKERILDMYSKGMSQRQIEFEIFGFNGGSAWRVVKEVIENG